MVKISDEISDLVFEFGGAFSGEHGDGIVEEHGQRKCMGKNLSCLSRSKEKLRSKKSNESRKNN